MNPFRSGKNLVQTLGLMALYAGAATTAKIKIRDPKARLKFFTENVGKYAGDLLKRFNVETKVVGYNKELMEKKNFLFIGNHLSYLDILILSSVQPTVFVTSVDLGEAFFLGEMAELGGSLFVERRNRSKINKDIQAIADVLRDGFNVIVYPEGTSGAGFEMLPFKKALFSTAIDAGVDIMPVVIKYKEIDGIPFCRENADRVCWYGDMSFAPHFLGMMKMKSVKAELHFLDPIPVTKESTRHELAEQAFKVISERYNS